MQVQEKQAQYRIMRQTGKALMLLHLSYYKLSHINYKKLKE